MPHTYTFKALTLIWTGDINGKADRLITTGLLGSIRWWFEIVARGLGGAPCDASNTKCIDRKHCVVCEFFGCTGWARKFRFDVLDKDDAGQQSQIAEDQTFKLRFTPLRAVRVEEWALLDLTLRLIAEHGAIGGKTVFKPTDEAKRQNEIHHQDFGLIELLDAPDRVPLTNDKAALEVYARDSRWRSAPQSGLAWASLTNFWSVPEQYLARQDANGSTFNQVIERGEPKNQAGNGDSWLAGRRARSRRGNSPEVKAESKKVFSFKEPQRTSDGESPQTSDGEPRRTRTFGFVNPSERITLNTIKQRLEAVWGSTIVDHDIGENDKIQLHTGSDILDELVKAEAT